MGPALAPESQPHMMLWLEAALSLEDALRALSPEAKAARAILLRRARQRRYSATPKGRLRHRSYNHSAKGRARAETYEDSADGQFTRMLYDMSAGRMLSQSRQSMRRLDAQMLRAGYSPEQIAALDAGIDAWLKRAGFTSRIEGSRVAGKR
jgi:hypothetical protein